MKIQGIDGMMEYWRNGLLTQPSTLPLFQYSNFGVRGGETNGQIID